MSLGQPEAGIAHIGKAIRLSPRDPHVSALQYGLGRCHLLLGHVDQAIELFDRVRTASRVLK
jgi:tetratricopeptide (TPR) repeat protein